MAVSYCDESLHQSCKKECARIRGDFGNDRKRRVFSPRGYGRSGTTPAIPKSGQEAATETKGDIGNANSRTAQLRGNCNHVWPLGFNNQGERLFCSGKSSKAGKRTENQERERLKILCWVI